MREQQRAAVWPYVEIGMGFNPGRGFTVRTYDQDIDPACIRSMGGPRGRSARVDVARCVGSDVEFAY